VWRREDPGPLTGLYVRTGILKLWLLLEISGHVFLLCRAEIADGIKNILFLVPYRAKKYPLFFFYPKGSRKGHSHWMARTFQNKYGITGDQVIEKAVQRLV
jgi:hypothetical protein